MARASPVTVVSQKVWFVINSLGQCQAKNDSRNRQCNLNNYCPEVPDDSKSIPRVERATFNKFQFPRHWLSALALLIPSKSNSRLGVKKQHRHLSCCASFSSAEFRGEAVNEVSREKISADVIQAVISETLITVAHIDLWLVKHLHKRKTWQFKATEKCSANSRRWAWCKRNEVRLTDITRTELFALSNSANYPIHRHSCDITAAPSPAMCELRCFILSHRLTQARDRYRTGAQRIKRLKFRQVLKNLFLFCFRAGWAILCD